MTGRVFLVNNCFNHCIRCVQIRSGDNERGQIPVWNGSMSQYIMYLEISYYIFFVIQPNVTKIDNKENNDRH